MPELPDIEAYLEALRPRVVGRALLGVRVLNPFLLRTVDPPLDAVTGGTVVAVSRLGKRLVFEIVADCSETVLFPRHPPHDRRSSAVEAQSRAAGSDVLGPVRRPARERPRGLRVLLRHVCSSPRQARSGGPRSTWSTAREALAALDPGGIEVVGLHARKQFAEALRRENRTLKRALTDPRVLSGIGNAYSDEILHRARLSPLKLTASLSDDEIASLQQAAVAVLAEWTERLSGRSPGEVPREGDRLQARHGGPRQVRLPLSGLRRRRYSASSTPTTSATTVPAARPADGCWPTASLSRLLKDDWPRGVRSRDDEDCLNV